MKKKPNDGLAQKLWNQFFRGKEKGTLIEAGASDGVAGSIGHWFERQKGWVCINLEPQPNCFASLQENRPECMNLPFAFSDREAVDVKMVCPVDGPLRNMADQASLQQDRWKIWNRRRTIEFEATLVRYDKLVGRLLVKPVDPFYVPVDLLVLDVEGHELAALRGMSGTSNLPTVICAEHWLVPAKDMRDILEPLGYEVGGADRENTYFVRKD